ncbi:glutaredoxin family protein [Gordonia sinesedis]
MTITLLTRVGCSACATALADLRRICAELGTDFDVVDVDQAAENGNRDLRADYGDRLPVVLLNDVEHSYWEVDEPRLRTDLAARG